MEPTAAEYFGQRAAAYDSLIRRCVPRYDEMQERLVRYVPAGVRRVLELGVGTGNLTLALGARFPDAEFVIVDASPEMLELASARLAERGLKVRAVETAFEDLPVDLGPFDLVTSSISLHHVLDKGALFRSVKDLLVPGGHLVFADQLRGGDERLHGINWEGWLSFCRTPGHCTEEEVDSLLEHADEHDHYASLAEHLRLLDAAGLVDLDCVWRNWIWGVLVARRPAAAT